jgi:Ca-activated chloride channel family protein
MNRILLLSDGVANLGTVAADEILKRVESFRKQRIYCSVYGFGMGTYDDELLSTLANKGDGTYAFVDSPAEARRVFVDELAATLNVVASDAKIQVEFNPARVKQYRQIGYEKRQLTQEQFRDDTVDAGEVGSGQSVTALYEVELQGTAGDPLGIVRVRYRDAETGMIEETSQPIRSDGMPIQFEDASVGFRLAASVAEFAELLRGSPFAAAGRFEDAARALRPVALALSLDRRVQELLRLVQSAGSLPQARE